MKERYPLSQNNLCPLSFIEDKPINIDRITALLQVSAKQNHWANFGPVSRLLEQHITSQLKIPTHGKVIATSSCTSALEAMVQALHYKLKRKPRIVTSSFSFYATNRGAYRNSIIIDCDEQGFLSFKALEKIPHNQYDAIVLTNIFGLLNNLEAYWNFALEHDKYLLVDNAAGYTAFQQRKVPEKMLEAISFHQTKPHGFGEGGCLIVSEEMESIIRSIINFGGVLSENTDKLGLNAKLSDPAAAFILQRLELHEYWAPHYIQQAERLLGIAGQAGLTRLVSNFETGWSVPGQIPFLSSRPLSKKELVNDDVILRKYYIPFDSAKVNSSEIFSRIVNIPCHPGLANIDDHVLFNLFNSLA